VKSIFQHPLRVTGRLLWLCVELLIAAITYACRRITWSQDALPTMRRQWLQHSSRRVLRILHAHTRASGNIPSSGLLVANHLSYLDILVLASITPCSFVSKHEVKSWPVFGWFATIAGTVFVNRERRTKTAQTTDEIAAVLDTGALLVIFPEGTSTGGDTLLPFKSSLLEPVARQPHPLNVCFLKYELDDGNVSEDVCYWRDMTLLPHMINLLSKRALRVSVKFQEVVKRSSDRKELARQLHAEVLKLK
jgi:1-acyl-sn-glycerol-3-phosphate acyltransferase